MSAVTDVAGSQYLPLRPMSTDRVPFPAWGDKEINRFKFRVALFTRRGMSQADAETWADRLFERDHERDDRRTCMECSNLRAGMRCTKGFAVLPETLQRCPSFSFETP